MSSTATARKTAAKQRVFSFAEMQGAVSSKILALLAQAASGSSSACRTLDAEYGIALEHITGTDFEIVQRCVIAIH